LKLLKEGRKASPGVKAVPGPLAQLGLGRDGTYFVIAAGRCNHAGSGSFQGVKDRGNQNFIGIEAENDGLPGDPWPDVQMEAYRRGVAAILAHLKKGSEFCVGHKEYAPVRKPDPSFDMDAFRLSVDAIIKGTAPPLTLIPPVEPIAAPGAASPRPTLRRGATGDLVKTVQKKIGVDQDGNFGPNTEAKLRIFQRDHNLVPDGIVGPKTWAELDKP
jgi:peptidoglycan hydrolase-like protein with peptidoglycan-binding domain